MDRLTSEQAALVFRRAAELEARSAGAGDELDVAALEQAGREAGLSPDAVLQGIAELRAEGLSDGDTERITDVVVTTTVDRRLADVGRAVVELITDEFFVVERDLGDRTLWAPETGVEAKLERRFSKSRFLPVTRIVAAVVEVPTEPPRTHVRLEAEVPGPSTARRAGIPAAIGAVAGGAAAVTEPAVGAWLAGTGVLCAGVGWSMARTRRLRLRALVRQGLANFLDWLGQ